MRCDYRREAENSTATAICEGADRQNQGTTLTPKKEDKLTESLENLLAEKYRKEKLLEDPTILLHPQCRKKPLSGLLKKKKGRSPRQQKHRGFRQEFHLWRQHQGQQK